MFDVSDRLHNWSFEARRMLRWSPPALKWPVDFETAISSFDGSARRRAQQLARMFDLSALSACCSKQDWRESLYVLDVLQQYQRGALPSGRCLDIGSKNGCYLPGLATAVPRGWDAVEIDAHRRYVWGATRRAYGEFMAASFSGCQFHACDVTRCKGPWAFATWFLPFLTEAPLRAWSLPVRLLQPKVLLSYVLQSLIPGGALLIVNQGEEEAAIQKGLLRDVGASFAPIGKVQSALSCFRKPRFGFWVEAP